MCDYAVTTTPAMLHSATKTCATLHSASGEFVLREEAVYPNGGRSLFYVLDKTALIVDEGICDRKPDEPPFDYSLITSKQNEYVARFDLVFRLLREDLEELNALLRKTDPHLAPGLSPPSRAYDPPAVYLQTLGTSPNTPSSPSV